jgi:hypothetical protein
MSDQTTLKEKSMKILRVFVACGLLLTAFSIAAVARSVQSDYDHSFNLAKLRSYDFYPQVRKPGDPLAQSPLNERRIHNALDSQLKSNGFYNSSDRHPDFMVAYFVTVHQGLTIQDNRLGVLRPRGDINVTQTPEGSLVVVVVDTATQQEVWRGILSGAIDPKRLEKDVNKGVAQLVQKFVKDQAGKK